MNYQEFLHNIKIAIGTQIDSTCTVDVQPIKKNNGTVLDGLVIINPSINISPTIYLNPYYHRYLSGQSINDISEDIIKTYKKVMPKKSVNIEFFKHFDQIKDSIVMRLINYDKNMELLNEIPHIRFHDLAIIFQALIFKSNEKSANITIYNSHLKLWNICINELNKIASINTPRLLPVDIFNMNVLLPEHLQNSYMDHDMYVVTNQSRTYGATSILYNGVLKGIAEELNSILIIIPSSIHEVLVFPSYSDYIDESLNQFIKEVNSTSVLDSEVLSDHAYYYSLKSDIVNVQFK